MGPEMKIGTDIAELQPGEEYSRMVHEHVFVSTELLMGDFFSRGIMNRKPVSY